MRAPPREFSTGGAPATVLVAILVIWLGFKLIGFAFKALAAVLLAGLAVAAFMYLTGRFGSPGDDA